MAPPCLPFRKGNASPREWLTPPSYGDHGAIWAITLACGIAVGGAIGALHGSIIAFLNVPAFIVTLGGLLVWRGATWFVTSGQTVAPMDATFRLMEVDQELHR